MSLVSPKSNLRSESPGPGWYFLTNRGKGKWVRKENIPVSDYDYNNVRAKRYPEEGRKVVKKKFKEHIASGFITPDDVEPCSDPVCAFNKMNMDGSFSTHYCLKSSCLHHFFSPNLYSIRISENQFGKVHN